jgi:hypothetical protein
MMIASMTEEDIEKRLIEIGFKGKRLQLHLRIWTDFKRHRKGNISIEIVENYLTGKNSITKSVIRYIFKIIQPEQPQAEEIEGFGVKKKAISEMSRKEKNALRIKIEESAMRGAKVNKVGQKMDHVDLDRFAPIVNSPCIGCVNPCVPEYCAALTSYVIG